MRLPEDNRWNDLHAADWVAFALAWLEELSGNTSRRTEDDEVETVSARVVRMNFTAAPEHQWRFILAAVEHAESEDLLDYIGAGPIEHLLGWHGEDFIDRIEHEATRNNKFRRALLNVWKYLMPDAVWRRVQTLQQRKP